MVKYFYTVIPPVLKKKSSLNFHYPKTHFSIFLYNKNSPKRCYILSQIILWFLLNPSKQNTAETTLVQITSDLHIAKSNDQFPVLLWAGLGDSGHIHLPLLPDTCSPLASRMPSTSICSLLVFFFHWTLLSDLSSSLCPGGDLFQSSGFNYHTFAKKYNYVSPTQVSHLNSRLFHCLKTVNSAFPLVNYYLKLCPNLSSSTKSLL